MFEIQQLHFSLQEEKQLKEMILEGGAVSEFFVLTGFKRFTNTPSPSVEHPWVPCCVFHDPNMGAG